MILSLEMEDDTQFGDSADGWGAPQMLITVFSVLGGVALGALIFYLARRGSPGQLGASRPIELQPAVSIGLQTKIEQIRAYLSSANRSESPTAGLSNASYALALLDDAEATYGPAAVAGVCNPDKLRRLIKKTQDRHGGALVAA